MITNEKLADMLRETALFFYADDWLVDYAKLEKFIASPTMQKDMFNIPCKDGNGAEAYFNWFCAEFCK